MNEAREQKNNPPEIQKADRSLSALVKDGKIYLPASFLSDEFGYAPDHIARLARQSKIQAICQDKKWYVTRESLLEYQDQAKQNKIIGGLKSTSVFSDRLQKRVPDKPASSSEGGEIVLSKTEPVSHGEGPVQSRVSVEKVQKFTFDNTLKNFNDYLNTVGKYLSKARTKTAGRAILVSAVFLIFILSGTFILVGASISKSLAEKIISGISTKSSDNLQVAGIGSWFDRVRDLIPDRVFPISQETEPETAPKPVQPSRVKGIPRAEEKEIPEEDILRGLPVKKEIAYLPPSFQDSLNDLNDQVKVLASRVDQIPPPLQFFGGSSGGITLAPVSTNTDNESVKTKTLTVETNLTVDTSTFYVDSTNNRVGVLTTSPETAFEVVGIASVSQFSGAGLTDCDAESQTLLWDSSTSKFSCGSDGGGGGSVSSNSLDFDEIVNSALLDTNFIVASGGFTFTVTDATTTIGNAKFDTGGNVGISAGGTIDTLFEVGGTASISGQFTFGNNSATGAIDTSDWDISSTGAITGVAFDANGTGNTLTNVDNADLTADTLDFTAISDTPTLDASLNISRAGFFIGLGGAPSTVFEVQGTSSASYLLAGNTLQVGGFASAAYSRFGIATATSSEIDTINDLLIVGALEVDANAFFDGKASISGNFQTAGRFIFGDSGDTGEINTSDWDISTGGALTGISGITNDGAYTQTGTSANALTGLTTFSGGVSVSTNFEVTSNNRFGINAGGETTTTLEVGGTASISGATTLRGIAYTWPSADGSANQVLHTNGSGVLTWDTDDSGGGGGTQIEVSESLTQDSGTKVSSISFDPNGFNVSFPAGGLVKLDWTNGPASRAANETITGLWEFRNGASFSAAANNVLVNLDSTGDFLIQDAGTNVLTVSDGGVFTFDSITLDGGIIGTTAGDLTINSAGALVVSDAITANGLITISGGASSSTGFEITTGNLGINAGAVTDTRLEVGGTASISGATTLNRVTYTWPSADGTDNFVLTTNGAGLLTWELDDTGGGSGIKTEEDGLQDLAAATILNFENAFAVTASGTTESRIDIKDDSLNFTELIDAAALDANFTVASAGFTFTVTDATTTIGNAKFDTGGNVGISAGGTIDTLFEVGGTASISGAVTLKGAVTGATGYNGLVVTPNNGTITTGVWNGTVIDSTYGGTGINNGGRTITLNAGNIIFAPPAAGATLTLANNFTTSGNNALTLTTTGATDVTLPTTGTLAILGANTFTGLQTFNSGASSSTGFEITTGNLGINSGAVTDTRLEVGGTASISGATTLRGVTYTWPSADGAGVLNSNGSGALSWAADDDVPESGDFTNLTGGLAIDNTAGTLDFDPTELTGNRSWSTGAADTSIVWTFDLSAGTDPTVTFRDNGISFNQTASVSSNFEVGGTASVGGNFAFFGEVLPDGVTCGVNQILKRTAANDWDCADDATSAGAGVSTIQEADVTIEGAATTIDFSGAHFTVTSNPAGEANIVLDWGAGGPASLSQNETVTGFWTFGNNVSVSSGFNLEVAGYASASQYFSGGLTDCDDINQKLSWTASGSSAGKFGCKTDQGGLESVQVFTASGSWSKPANINYIMVELVGAGGSGGAGSTGDSSGGGGAGGYSSEIIESPGATETVTVGSEGNGDADGGQVGSATDFGTVSYLTGNGGGGGVLDSDGGTGGTATGGDINIQGNDGGTGSGTAAPGNDGGGSYFGGRGQGAGLLTGCTNATGYGSGGGGNSISGNGCDGFDGVVIVWEYSGKAAGADYAEWYETDGSVVGGDIVSIGEGTLTYQTETGIHNSAILKKATNGNEIFGVVSTRPKSVIGDDIFGVAKAPRPIALSGRVPVNVSTKNGPIKKGDLLTISSIPGVAVRTDKAGQIIGLALEDYDAPTDQVDKILVFVNTGYSTGARLKGVLAKQGINIEEIPQNVDVGRIILAQLLSQKKNITKETELSEIFSDRIVAGLEIITPRVVTDTVVASKLEPVEKDIELRLGEDGKFIITSTASNSFSTSFGNVASESLETPVITFDSLGNAFFAGEITAASISAQSISGLEVITDKISMLSDEVASVSAPKESISISNLSSDNLFSNNLIVLGLADFRGSASFGIVNADKINAIDIESREITEILDSIEFLANKLNQFEVQLNSLATKSADFESRITILEDQVAINANEILQIKNALSVDGITALNGGLQVGSISSIGDAISLLNDTVFFGRPYFNTDTGGFALIKTDAKSVDVTFDREYLEQPIVNANISVEANDSLSENDIFVNNIQYLVTKKTTKGFTIVLNKQAPDDIRFSWIALAVKSAKVFNSIEVVLTPSPELTPEPSSEPAPEPTPEPSPEVSPEASPEPPPSEEITLTQEASPSPTPEPTPELSPELIPEPITEPTLESTPELSE